jgi:hypothetical protein
MEYWFALRCAAIQRNYAVYTDIVTSESQNKQNINLFLIVMRVHWGWGGMRDGAVGWGRKVAVRFPMDSLDFFIDLIFPASLCPRGRLSL